jgi:hypothetical protein
MVSPRPIGGVPRRAGHAGDPVLDKRLLMCLLIVGLASGCQSNRRAGGVFRPYSPPSAEEALVYVYRLDALKGIEALDIEVDGEGVGDMRDKEYLALVLPPGEHSLSLRRRWLGFIPLAWTDHRFEAEPGSTTYLRVWAGYEAHLIPGSAGSAPGRADGSTSVSLYASRWVPKIAELEIRGCRRAPGN